MHALVKMLDRHLKFKPARAHCDIPCKIYDPGTALLASVSVIRFMDLIAELETKLEAKEGSALADQALLSRLVIEKETHATKVKDEITTIWGDYFKQVQFDQFPGTHELVHKIMLAASACKQNVAPEYGEKLLLLVNEFAASFWATKDVETRLATCPYPPNAMVIYPVLS